MQRKEFDALLLLSFGGPEGPDQVRPFLEKHIPSECRLVTSQGAVSIFEHARTLLPESAHGAIEDLASICEERRQLGVQQRLHA